MDRIKVLSSGVANQIAAGEVVGRPASVVKELVENAVDAGGRAITVNFRDGGRTLIQVVDNGCGMSEGDALRAFERHATSKISSTEDLYRLASFGFRGEALPSIGSVAEVELLTRTAESELGSRVVMHGGRLLEQAPVQCPYGTQLLVKNLFYNVPARRRFLKEAHIEARHVITEFQRVALCNPHIAFSLYNNDTPVYLLSEGNTRQRIAAVHGKGVANGLLELFVDTSLGKIEGFVGDPSLAKKTNKEQYLFVNGRYFRSPYFHKAIMQAYNKLIPADTQPSYFLYLEVDPASIDVNVSPAKTEVKFDNEQALWQIVNAAVRESLGKLGVVPLMDFEMDESFDIPVYREGTRYKIPETGANPNFNPFQSESSAEFPEQTGAWAGVATGALGGGFARRGSSLSLVDAEREFVSGLGGVSMDDSVRDFITGEGTTLQGAPEHSYEVDAEYIQGTLDVAGDTTFEGLLSLGATRCATVWGEALVVVDLLRARERVMYERYLRLIGNNAAVTQQLLFPERVELSIDECTLLEQASDEVSALGFEFTLDRSGQQAEFTGIPPELTAGMIAGVLAQLLATLSLSQESGVALSRQQQLERLAALMAQEGAQRTAATFTQQTIAPLLEDLRQCDNQTYTPSGLPIFVWITPQELTQRLKK